VALLDVPDEGIRLRAHADDWRQAVLLAGEALVAAGATTAAYAARMVKVVDDFGSYIVIAPGLALAHARPGPDVLHDALAVVTLEEPVRFGHAHNDPVSVVLRNDGHVNLLAELANVFNDPNATAMIAAARTADEVRAVLAPHQGVS
jgi:PTS system ascorbate-specific IIA component